MSSKPTSDQSEEQRTYLIAWNPNRFAWEEQGALMEALRQKQPAVIRWSCGTVKQIPVGSRVFMIRLGSDPRGLIASGVTTDEVTEGTHWTTAGASAGKKARFVKVRLDVLVRTPLIRRFELDDESFKGFRWDTQMSGVRIPSDIARALEREWEARVAAPVDREERSVVPVEVVRRWSRFWNAAAADAEWVERNKLLDEKREEAIPEIMALLETFLKGAIDVETFRATFDSKTKNEWDLFGLKGMSGAMFLNKLCKHISDKHELEAQLRRAIARPKTETDARRQLEEFMQYLDELIGAEIVARTNLQPNRTPFFLSACWHAQSHKRWPIIYQSARKALRTDGLLGRKHKGPDDYIEFVTLYQELSQALDLTFWELEHLCNKRVSQSEDSTEGGGGEQPDEVREQVRIWLISPGPRAGMLDAFWNEEIIGIGWSELGDLSQMPVGEIRDAIREHRGDEVNPIHDVLACQQFAQEMRVGDIIFAKRGRTHIVGYGRITSAYRYEPQRGEYPHVRSVDWKMRGEWKPRDRPLVTKTLTEIGKYPKLVQEIRAALGIKESDADAESDERETRIRLAYSIDEAAKDLFLPREKLDEILMLLEHKKNLVLQGPPGTGKTFLAKRLAYLLLREKDEERVEQVQFHQSYSYEDFVQGYRPTKEGGFERRDGPFLRFCDKALQDLDSDYVLIVDEINRGNLSKILGELMLLLESDKRSESWATTLTYSQEGEARFWVPDNVHVIGTMNTADRSLALVDYALRRRFVFVDVEPAFQSAGFTRRLETIGVSESRRLAIINRLQRLNMAIAEDPNLGMGYRVGHSYFCHADDGEEDAKWYERVVVTEVAPLLREYWPDEPERVEQSLSLLLKDEE